MPIVTQQRAIPVPSSRTNATWYVRNVEGPWPFVYPTAVNGFAGSETTVSFRQQKGKSSDYEGMSGPELYRNIAAEYQTRYDNGHDFSTTKQWVDYPSDSYRMRTPFDRGVQYEYRGVLWLGFSAVPVFPTASPLTSNSTLDILGSKLIGLSSPTAAEAAAATFLGELYRDGFPKLQGWTTAHEILRKKKLKNIHHHIGDEYLNHQFGVMPFKRDIQKMAQAVIHQSKIWKQLTRDSNRVVRRRHSLAREEYAVVQQDDSPLVLPTVNNQPAPPMFSVTPPTRVIDVTTVDTWFTGAFTYYLNQAHSFLDRIDEFANKANHLLGTNITLETLYDLTRWSWLLDWFTNVGDFLHNIDLLHSDSLVMRYGYVMRHSNTCRTRSVTGLKPLPGGSLSRQEVVLRAYQDSKQRRRATPYGFGLNVQDFSPQRWAILGALGLTRAPKTLQSR